MRTYPVQLPSFNIVDLMFTAAQKGGRHYMINITDNQTTHLNIISFGPQQNQKAEGCFTVIASNENNTLKRDDIVKYYVIHFSTAINSGTCMEFDDVEFLSNPFTRMALNIGSKITHNESGPDTIGCLDLKKPIIREFNPWEQKMDTGIFSKMLASCYRKWDTAYQHNWQRDHTHRNGNNIECPCGAKWESLKYTLFKVGQFTVDIRSLHTLICHPELVPQGELDKILALFREEHSINPSLTSENWRNIDWKDYRRYVLGTDAYMNAIDKFIPRYENYILR